MRALLAVGVCAGVLALGGCGGGDGESASTSSATGASTTTTAPQATTQTSAGAPRPSQQGAGAGLRGGQGDGSPSGGEGKGPAKQSQDTVAVRPPRVSSAPVAGTKAPAPGVKTVEGADDSVQTYGVESDEAARTEAATALAAYLDARRREDWTSACEALASKPKQQLDKLAKSASAQGKEINGCAGAMAALGGSQQFPGETISEVLSLRGGGEIPGDPSYLIFTGPPGKTFFSMPMYLEDGGWKVGLAVPAELPL